MLHVGAETLAGGDGSLEMDDQELSERPITGPLSPLRQHSRAVGLPLRNLSTLEKRDVCFHEPSAASAVDSGCLTLLLCRRSREAEPGIVRPLGDNASAALATNVLGAIGRGLTDPDCWF